MRQTVETAAGVTATVTDVQVRDEEVWVRAEGGTRDLADQDGEAHTDADGWTYLGQVEDFPDLAESAG